MDIRCEDDDDQILESILYVHALLGEKNPLEQGETANEIGLVKRAGRVRDSVAKVQPAGGAIDKSGVKERRTGYPKKKSDLSVISAYDRTPANRPSGSLTAREARGEPWGRNQTIDVTSDRWLGNFALVLMELFNPIGRFVSHHV